jgi:hypothetical protein
MKTKRFLLIGAAAAALLAAYSIAQAGTIQPHQSNAGATLIQEVRRATAPYQNVAAVEAAGYALFHGCVNGPQAGAMGVHFVNGDLVGDGKVDALKPEALMYEMKNGQMQLVGVEYVVFAEAWDAANKTPPMLKGQLFTYNSSPNRYGIPAFYALHVWTKPNPNGAFADWNPRVSCEEYTADDAMQSTAAHRSGH